MSMSMSSPATTVQLETHRQATAVALRSLQSELEALREVHAREIDAVRKAGQEELHRVREWCVAQVNALNSNRDAIVEQCSAERVGTATADFAQLARVEAEHREQQSALRSLLVQESERSAAARAECLAVSIAASNEKVAMLAALATARRRSAAATAESSHQVNAAQDLALGQVAELRKALHAAQRKCEVQAGASARMVAESALRFEEAAAGLRRENEELRQGLGAAQAAIAKANERAHRAHARATELGERLRAAETRLSRSRHARGTGVTERRQRT